MYHSRTKKVVSYGRRAQRVVAVSDDRRFGRDVFSTSKEEDELVHSDIKGSPEDVFERPRQHAPSKSTPADVKTARRFEEVSTPKKHVGKKTLAKDTPIRKPLGDRPVNVSTPAVASPKTRKVRAGNSKAILLGARQVSTTPPLMDVDIIILDDDGNQLDKQHRVTKNAQRNTANLKPGRRPRRPTIVKSCTIYVSEEGDGGDDDDDDDEYHPTPRSSPKKSRETLKEPRGKTALRKGGKPVQREILALAEESPDKSQSEQPRKPKASRRAARTIVVTDSDSSSDVDEQPKRKENRKAKSKRVSNLHTPRKRDTETETMWISTPSLRTGSNKAEESYASKPSLLHYGHAIEGASSDRLDDRTKKLTSATAQKTKEPRRHFTSPKPNFDQPPPHQIAPVPSSHPEIRYRQRPAKACPSRQAITLSDNDLSLSMDEELELALHIADLELAKATEPVGAGPSALKSSAPTKAPIARPPLTSTSQKPRIPSFLRPLLSECGQLATFNFASFIETFPADPIIGFSGHSTLPYRSGSSLSFDSYQKVGEASYSEVFGIGNVVLKIVPLFDEENDVSETWTAKWDSPPVSEVQDVLKEIVVTRAMGEICKGFIKLLKAHVVQGSYPQSLLALWDKYQSSEGSESVRPDHFTPKQTYAVIILPNGGPDLENFSFNSLNLMGGSGWRQACSIFWQVVRSLGNAEDLVHFEHRDLHWGQILVRSTMRSSHVVVPGSFGKVMLDDPWHGVQSTIIDLGLSRIDHGHGDSFWTPFDDEIFEGEGDYQFDIYRMMRRHIKEDWSSFRPFTNVMWLHYLTDKLIHQKHLRSPPRTVPKHNRRGLQGGAQLAIVEADRRAYDCLVEMERVLGCSVSATARSVGARSSKMPKFSSDTSHDSIQEMRSAGDVLRFGKERGWLM